MWPPDDAEAFWSWSCERYARPGVGEACLGLQDRWGAIVNLLLLGCWLADGHRALTLGQAARASGSAAAFQITVVRPLRETRRMLRRLEAEAAEPRRTALSELRRSVAADELAAERIEQCQLQLLVADCPADARPALSLAMANLAALMPPEIVRSPGLERLVARILEAPSI
jgi:uncharacterized protein (TIGR02444 family)